MSEFDETEVMKKAKQFRYRKGALSLIQHDQISDEFYKIYDEAGYFLEADREELLPALGYDDELLDDIIFSLSDLTARLENIGDELRNSYVTEYFDDYLVKSLGDYETIIGYDAYETDYFGLCQYEADLAKTESGKRLMRLTKEQIISVGGQCFGILLVFLELKHEYDCITSVFGLIKDERNKLLDTVSTINMAYEEWADADKYSKEKREAEKRLDNAIKLIPYNHKAWVV